MWLVPLLAGAALIDFRADFWRKSSRTTSGRRRHAAPFLFPKVEARISRHENLCQICARELLIWHIWTIWVNGRTTQERLNKWFNTACFIAPAAFTFGNESRTDPELRTAGVAN